MSLPPSCSRCGCDESEHGIEDDIDPELEESICTGCGEPCTFETDEVLEDDDKDRFDHATEQAMNAEEEED
jgi:hypothetical protein